MIKTQIQLPLPLYKELKRVAKEHDWSLAEVLRRGGEYMIRCYRTRQREGAWQIPKIQGSEPPRVHFSKWRELANDPGDV